MSKDSLSDLIDKDQLRLLKQKMKALGIDDKCIKAGDVEELDFISTGVFEVDSLLGAGMGIPSGTLIEFCGESQSGKTWLGYKLIGQAQKIGKKCAFFNIENSYYPQRAMSCGVNINQLVLVENVGSAEKYGELLKYMVQTGEYAIVVVDSVSAMIPQDELTKTLEQVQSIASHAKFVKRLTKDLTAKTSETGTIVVLINQLYTGAGAMPGTFTKTASGGNAMNYFTHMRLWINKINGANGQVTKKDAEGKDVIIGGKSKVLVMKTRYGTPGLTGEFKIMFTDDETTNPLDEFLYRSKAKGFEFIKELRKKFIYINGDTGEQIESKDSYEFVNLLISHPAPLKKTRGDESKTVFEYITGRLKITGKSLEDLLAFIKKGPPSDLEDISDPFDEEEDDGSISFEEAAKEML